MLKPTFLFILATAVLSLSVSSNEIDFTRMSEYQYNLLTEHEHEEFLWIKSMGGRRFLIENDRATLAPHVTEIQETASQAVANTKTVFINGENGIVFGDGKEFLSDREVVLTFDDGPNPVTTPIILDILKKYRIKAVFFIVGHRIFSSPEGRAVLKRIAAEGHAIGNHSYTHPGLKGLFAYGGAPAVIAEMAGTHQAIFNTVGFVDPFFRFPGGTYNDDLQRIIRDHRLTNWKWNIDSLDYMDCAKLDAAGKKCLSKFSIPEMAENAVINVSKGLDRYKKGIVLFHDIKSQTVMALPRILDEAIRKGYTFVLPQVERTAARRDNPLLSQPTHFRTN